MKGGERGYLTSSSTTKKNTRSNSADKAGREQEDEKSEKKKKKISPSNLQFTNFIDCPSEREKKRKPLENARSTNERKEKRGTEGVEQQVVASVERRQR